MTADLRAACADIAAWLPRAAELIAEQDEDGTSGGGKPGSSPPWNPAAASVFYDAHAMVRDTLAIFQLYVTGSAGLAISWSDGSTYKALHAIEKLGEAVPRDRVRQSTRDLVRCVMMIRQLPAIDEIERSRRLDFAACPYCGFAMLQVYPRSGGVACLRGEEVCTDSDGHVPRGFMTVSALDGSPRIAWADGLVT